MFVPEYALPVVAGIVLTLAYPTSKHIKRADPDVRRGYRILLVVTAVFGIAGAKLVALMGDRLWPVHDLENGWRTVVESGRSIVGGLLFGHVASEITRPIIGYKAPPNDKLAVAVCLSVAVGRIGCALAGCCRGIPWDSPISLTYDDDHVARFPLPFLELAFHVALAAAFIAMERRRVLFGRLFSTYLVVYGVFRFFTEPLRATPKPLWGFSVYQAFAIVLVVVGGAGLLWRSLSSTWVRRLGPQTAEVP